MLTPLVPISTRPYKSWPTSALIAAVNSGRLDRMDPIVAEYVDAELQNRNTEEVLAAYERSCAKHSKFAYRR